ncbi:MAG: class IV adenylate cyclase [Thermoanaerobaculia bacterium]
MKEIEVKLPVKDFKEVKGLLKKLKAKKKFKETLERNILFDHKSLKLKERDWVLRLRQFGEKNILTLKTKSIGRKGFKVREEVNIFFEDFEKMKEVFQRMGFFEAFYYEKYREEYELNGLSISLDKTPVGNYVEIEGDYKKIENFLKKIGAKIEETLSLSYFQLFRIFNKKSKRMQFK